MNNTIEKQRVEEVVKAICNLIGAYGMLSRGQVSLDITEMMEKSLTKKLQAMLNSHGGCDEKCS